MLTNRILAQTAGYRVKEYPKSDTVLLVDASGNAVDVGSDGGVRSSYHITRKDRCWDHAPDFLNSVDAALTLPFDDDVERGLICDPGKGWVYVTQLTLYWDTVPRIWYEHPARAICETWKEAQP